MSLTQPLQQLLENLMALKDDYQAQLSQSEYKVNLALEQISHVNALLVDQLGYQELTQSLIGLRSHYQSIAAQHQQSATHASSQLAHINALLADQLVLQQQLVSIPASSTIAPTQQLQQLNPEPEPQDASANIDLDQPTDVDASANIDLDQSTDVDASANIDLDHPTDVDASEASEDLDSQEQDNLSSPTKTRLLPEYQNLSKIQAVEKLLRANQGSILHVDYIIRALYGEMDALAIKEEKPRMYDTLTQGTKKGLWVKVPDSPSCYTIDLKLVPSDEAVKQQSTERVTSHRTTPAKGKADERLLPAYKHLNLTSAVESVVHQYAGQILTTEQIAKELFGELSGKTLTQAKNKIGKTLWSGSKQGRWQSIPGKIGCYTLDRKKLKR